MTGLRRGQRLASVMVGAAEDQPLISAVLQVASASTKMDVGLSPKELAVEQLKTEEKQRLFGVFPKTTSLPMTRIQHR